MEVQVGKDFGGCEFVLSDPNQNRNQKLRMNRMAETSIFLVACAHACDFVVVVVVLGKVLLFDVICVFVKVKMTFRLVLATLEGLVLDLSKPISRRCHEDPRGPLGLLSTSGFAFQPSAEAHFNEPLHEQMLGIFSASFHCWERNV